MNVIRQQARETSSSLLLTRLERELDKLRAGRMVPSLRIMSEGALPRLCLDGKTVLVLCSNDYLGLANDDQVKAAATAALSKHGCGLAAGRTIAGTTEFHVRLEQELAVMSGHERALLFTSAYTANLGLLTTVLGKGDFVFSDQLNHASIIDGCRYSGATVRVYPHGDMTVLQQQLADTPPDTVKVIVTDGVFSMEGDIAPLPQLVELKHKSGATLVVDEAHGVGVLGKTGKGTIEHFGLQGEIDIQVGTLGKALGGALGGYVTGTRALIEVLMHRCRTFIFTNPVPASVAAGALAALKALRERPELLDRLWRNTHRLRSEFEAMGFKIVPGETPIIPILLGDDALASTFSALLFERGIHVQAFTYPVVPPGAARLRCIVSAAQEPPDIDDAIAAFKAVGLDLGVIA